MSGLTYAVQPITDWSTFTNRSPKPNPFRASWSDTLDLLGRELEHLGATDVVLELDVQAGQVRRDGMLRSDAKVGHRAARLSFQSKRVGAQAYPCDAYEGAYYSDPASWKINLRAIAVSLEALRKVDRHGVTKGEQYAGFAQLPAGSGAGPSHMTRDVAAAALELAAIGNDGSMRDREIERILADPAHAKAVLRHARAATHPDRGGDRAVWDRVQEAAAVLGVS